MANDPLSIATSTCFRSRLRGFSHLKPLSFSHLKPLGFSQAPYSPVVPTSPQKGSKLSPCFVPHVGRFLRASVQVKALDKVLVRKLCERGVAWRSLLLIATSTCFRVEGSGLRVHGRGFRVEGSGFGVQG